MDNLDFKALERARDWISNGSQVYLVTVTRTWGSAPRPVGSHAIIRDDGQILGSVSGGCVEDDLARTIRLGTRFKKPELITYGIDQNEARRWGLPCGGKLELVVEPVNQTDWIDSVLQDLNNGRRVNRVLNITTGETTVNHLDSQDAFQYDGISISKQYGPRWRLLMIGAGQLSEALAPIARQLDFDVYICDPRTEYRSVWTDSEVTFLDGMPDDAVIDFKPDVHTAIVALSHDPKIDDMALLEALKSDAFYVGALGSQTNTTMRKGRLALFDLSVQAIARLHGPIGLYIGSKTPAEIAVSIAAELVSVRNGVQPVQRREFQLLQTP